jgi:Glyoxalase-like domain
MFWRDALGWPLVWDQNEQTAVQSPLGGTKISWDLWGAGSPAERKNGRNRQSFDLVTDDPPSEAERLVSLGAIRLSDLPDGVEMADPDGNEFGLHADRASRTSLPSPVVDPSCC